MGKYSSDSDSSSFKSRSKRRKRSSSSSSSSVKRSSHRSKHSSSSSRRDYYSKSSSRPKSRRSRSKSSNRTRSYSREVSRRRSRSYEKYSSKSKTYKSKSNSSRRSSSKSGSSKSSSPIRKNVSKPANAAEALREKLLKSIQAADSADKVLKQQGALPKNFRSRNDLDSLVPSKPSTEVLNDIENDSFQQRVFVSVKNIEIPEIKLSDDKDNVVLKVVPISIYDDQETKLNRWVKKLFQIRQKALKGDGVE